MYEHVYTSTQLKTHLREIKDIAEHDMVYITEHGVISYFFCSVDVYNRFIEEAERAARWKAEAELALCFGEEDAHEGRRVRVAERVCAAQNFTNMLEQEGLSLGSPDVRVVVEYLSGDPRAGKRIDGSVEREGQDPLPAYKFFCAGYDVIYEYDGGTNDVLLCGIAESLDNFGITRSKL